MNRLPKRNLLLAGVISIIVIALVIGAVRPRGTSGAGPTVPAEVMVAQVEQKDVPIYGEWIGTLDGLTNADVRAQVTGYLLRQGYQEGAFVKKVNCSLRLTHGPSKQHSTRLKVNWRKPEPCSPIPKLSKGELSLT